MRVHIKKKKKIELQFIIIVIIISDKFFKLHFSLLSFQYFIGAHDNRLYFIFY